VRGPSSNKKATAKLLEQIGHHTNPRILGLAWKNGKVEISGRNVFDIDESGMVGSRQMARMPSKLHEAGAKPCS
jgi:hypothetical protein